MRIFRKKYETPVEAVYNYLCENHKLPFTGLIRIQKDPLEISVEKLAEGEWNPEKAAYAAYTLVKEKYPKQYTSALL